MQLETWFRIGESIGASLQERHADMIARALSAAKGPNAWVAVFPERQVKYIRQNRFVRTVHQILLFPRERVTAEELPTLTEGVGTPKVWIAAGYGGCTEKIENKYVDWYWDGELNSSRPREAHQWRPR